MDVSELKNDIKTGSFKPFYIFAGEEWKVQSIYLDHIAQAANKSLRRIDSIGDVYAKLKTPSFTQQTYVYVVRDDKEIMSNEKLQSQLTNLLGSNILVLQLTSLDKRLKFYKAYKDAIIIFEPLKPEILRKYIQREISLSDKNCEKLMEVCEYDYGRCLLEIDKIHRYAVNAEMHGYDMDSNESFEDLLKDGTIYTPPKDAIFDFIDAVLDAKVNKAFDLYSQCLQVGEAVMVMITVLYNNVKALLQVQTCQSSDVSKATGLTGWQIQNARKHLNIRSAGQLVKLLKLCQHCQQGIVTGTLDEEYVMEYILTEAM